MKLYFFIKLPTPANSFCAILILCFAALGLTAQTDSPKKSGGNFVVENYYKAKWGYADEFISLWKKNHYPLLKKALEKGDIISISAEKPWYHSGEDTRWDFRVTLVFKNVQLAFDPELTKPYTVQLYPDQEKLAKDEQHRFELLLAHWDVMSEKIDL